MNQTALYALEAYQRALKKRGRRSSKAEVLGTLLKQLGCEAACLVGDREFDIDTARQNQIPLVGCAYGYAPEESR